MHPTRRELGVALAAAPLMQMAGGKISVAVIGAGVFGAWTALHLRRAGHEVTLIDSWGPGNSRASSGGESRIIRAAYGADEIYSQMARRSLGHWEAVFARMGRPLFVKTGVLWLTRPGNSYADHSKEVLRKLGISFSDLSEMDVKRHYAQFRCSPGTIGIFEPESGALMARQAVGAVVDEYRKLGGVYRHALVSPPRAAGRLASIETSEGETVAADEFVFACGPWLPKVFPEVLGNRIFPTRQEVLFFGVPAGSALFAPPMMPVWIDFSDDRGMYGFPDLEQRGFKVAFAKHGPAFDPDNGSRLVSPEKAAEARAYVAERFPALADAPVIESRVCQYENTSNGDFLIDRHPGLENVWLAGGGSGHGFKHGPAVGEYVAARITGAGIPAVEPRFSLAAKKTEQQRAVY